MKVNKELSVIMDDYGGWFNLHASEFTTRRRVRSVILGYYSKRGGFIDPTLNLEQFSDHSTRLILIL